MDTIYVLVLAEMGDDTFVFLPLTAGRTMDEAKASASQVEEWTDYARFTQGRARKGWDNYLYRIYAVPVNWPEAQSNR